MDGMAKGEAAAVLTVEAGPVEASDHERAQIVVLLPARQVLANLLAPPNLLTLHGAMPLVSETAKRDRIMSTEPSSIEGQPALFFLGHISPIFARFFAVFSLFSPS